MMEHGGELGVYANDGQYYHETGYQVSNVEGETN
jgi:hypothetical protein